MPKAIEQNKNIIKIPIYYGTVSQCKGKHGDTYYYKWIAFVKSANNYNLDFVIENVKFILHETFTNTIRVKTLAPYIIEEIGWG